MGEGSLPRQLTEPLTAGCREDWQARGLNPRRTEEFDEIYARWFRLLIHGELDAVREQHGQAEDQEVFASVTEAEQVACSAEAEAQAGRILDALAAAEAEAVDWAGDVAGS